MVGEDEEDSIIRRRAFKISDSLELNDILLPQDEAPPAEKTEEEPIDEALGEIYDPFADLGKDGPGAVQRDGSVISAPDPDLVSDLARDGERKVNWGLMVTMIFVYSAVSIQAGIALPPLYAGLILVTLAALGFYLGEMWVPRARMHLLGITWVIISMKVLYGLALELHRWDFISIEMLGPLLLFLVAVNIYVAYRHNHDAIAAQSTLILLAIGSTAGSVFGEIGVAAMILVATLLVHGLALHRHSGNLAALGIASTNLWIGMHALTNGITAGSLVIHPLDTPLLLFLLMMLITAINAVMAARFAREENWFSSGFKAAGLGRPGLWGVSISLGMVGAILVLAAVRNEVGYALGLVTLLGGAFGASYLVVRGVEWTRVTAPLASVALLLTTMLLAVEQGVLNLPIDSYELFTIIGAAITAFVMLRDQNSVTDRVLWTGSIAVLSLLVILVPAEPESMGGDGGVLLLVLLSALHIGTATLAVIRNSPSLAGVTVLLPWTWVIIEEVVQEAIRTVLVANDVSDPGSIIELDPIPLAAYLSIVSVLMIFVNIRLGETGVNLASRFLGLTEISASIRDSGMLQLWSLGLWLPLITILFMAKFGGFTSPTLLLILGLLVALHLASELRGERIGDASVMFAIIAVFFAIFQWQYGMTSWFMLIFAVVTMFLLFQNDGSHEGRYTMGMAMMALPMLLYIARRDVSKSLPEIESIPSLEVEYIALICTTMVVGAYLPKAPKMEKLLNPALACLLLLSTMIALAQKQGDFTTTAGSLGLFAGSTIWLVGNGEVRRELMSVARRDSLREMAREKMDFERAIAEEGGLGSYDPRQAELQARRKKSREKGTADDLEELYLTEATHTPILITLVLGLVMGSAVLSSLMSGPSPLILLGAGLFATVLIGIARQRTRSLELDLPHFAGMEMPIAISIAGIAIAHTLGHIGPGASNRELFDMAIVVLIILELCIISLMGQKNLLDRIPIAIDWFILPLLVSRMVGAVLVEALPFPLTINPFEGEMIEWTMPWMLLETLLVLCVICSVWINGKREAAGREVSGNEAARAIAIVMLSFGPAGMLAIFAAMRHTWRHVQPTGMGIVIPSAIISLFAFSRWIDGIASEIPIITLALGFILVILLAATVPAKSGEWTMMLAVNSHLMIFIGVMMTGNLTSIMMPALLILLSTTVWVVGILTLRRVLRIWGLADLVIAVIGGLIFLGPTLLEPTTLLIALMILALELGLVAWLGLSHEEELLRD